MMPYACRLGDPASHPGQITTAASHTYIVGVLAAREGDVFSCIEHGPNPIASGSLRVRIEGQAAAREGDVTSCGAVLVATQQRVDVR